MSRGNLIELLLSTKKVPFVVGVSHLFAGSPNYFQYRFTKSKSAQSSSARSSSANLSERKTPLPSTSHIGDKLETGQESMNIKMQVEISQIMQVGKYTKVVEQVTHEFLIFFVSKKSVILFADYGIGQPPTCLSLKYSKLSKTWTAIGTYHQVSSLFTINSANSGGYGLLSELFCKTMRICLTEPSSLSYTGNSSSTDSHNDEDEDDSEVAGTLNISCHGPCGVLLNSSVVVDPSDFPAQNSKPKTARIAKSSEAETFHDDDKLSGSDEFEADSIVQTDPVRSTSINLSSSLAVEVAE